ncbi:hypothetical protein CHUAL_006980 [Chamberlinius hualienensis]
MQITEDNPLFRFTGYPTHRHDINFGKSHDHRRSNKPIMEKRRRARINHCLAELKALILEAMKKDPARHSKLEKADILEMTVKHLQTVQRQQMAMAVATDPTVMTKFRSGFNDCASEVVRYVSRLDGVDPGVCQRLMGHMRNCLTSLNQFPSPFQLMSGPQIHPSWFYPPNASTTTTNSSPFSFDQRSSQQQHDDNHTLHEKKFDRSAFVSLIKETTNKIRPHESLNIDIDRLESQQHTVIEQTTEKSREPLKPSTSTKCTSSDTEKMWRPW